MLFVDIEHYRNGDPAPVYRRFRGQGRLMPDGVRYVTHDPARWADLVDVEGIPVISSAEAAARVPGDR